LDTATFFSTILFSYYFPTIFLLSGSTFVRSQEKQ
jgi:hypothetical protein